jgi:heme O synthase-like polyprenyltransferase
VPLGLLGMLYGAVALGAGIWFLVAVLRSVRADDPRVDYRVFKISIAYLFLVFGAMLFDCAVRPFSGSLEAATGLHSLWVGWPPVL